MSNAIAALTRSKPSRVSSNISAWRLLRLTYRESLRGNIPMFIHSCDGKQHDINVVVELFPETGTFYILDRGYLNFARRYSLTQCAAFFVIRGKSNLQFHRLYSHAIDKETGRHCHQTIWLTRIYSGRDYPKNLRHIKYHDAEGDKTFVFLTNNFTLPPLMIAALYRYQWQVKQVFKWIKHHLRIKAFYGTTENAVKTQIGILVSVYVLVAIIKKWSKLQDSLYTILQALSTTLFERRPSLQSLTDSDY